MAVRGDGGSDALADVAHERGPSISAWQLLSDGLHMLQGRVDIDDHRLDGLQLAVQRREVQMGLPGIAGGLAHRSQQQRSAGHRLQPGPSSRCCGVPPGLGIALLDRGQLQHLRTCLLH